MRVVLGGVPWALALAAYHTAAFGHPLRTGYDYRYHKAGVPADNPNTRIVDGEFADWFGVGGPPAYLIERLGQLVEAGIDYFVSVLEGTEQERFAAEVMPTVRDAR